MVRWAAWRILRRDPVLLVGIVVAGILAVTAVFAPYVAPYDPFRIDLRQRLQPPGQLHWLGTDEFGRDLCSRLFHGGRITLATGMIAIGIAVAGGVPLGLAASLLRELEEWLMRFNDVLLALPGTLVAIAIVAIAGPGLYSPALGVGLSSIPVFARLTRSVVVAIRDAEFVESARALGVREGRIAIRHILPHCISPIVVFASLQFGTAVLLVASLSFLGLGVQPPVPEWGAMVNAGRLYLRTAPHLVTVPSVALFVVAVSANLMGDAIRDVLDPRLRRLL